MFLNKETGSGEFSYVSKIKTFFQQILGWLSSLDQRTYVL